jgi:UDP-N-acetylmuramoylalanine--D-glutamate ligase
MIDLFFFKGYPVAVMGLGRSGLATAEALRAAGAQVCAWDDNPQRRAEAQAAGLPMVDLHTCSLEAMTALVLAPGIPHTHPEPNPVAARFRFAGLPIIGDIELLARAEPHAQWIGITGTNGKSTTTSLIGHILQLAGRPVAVGGNLGTPALALAALGATGTYVLELSSYQLELTFTAPYEVAVLLNITPDHLDRHGGMDGYAHAKSLIFEQENPARTAVIGQDDAPCRALSARLREAGRRVVPVSAKRVAAGGVYVIDGMLIDDTEGMAESVADLRAIPSLPGRHNWQNAAAAYAATRLAGVHPGLIVRCLATFPGLAHRQQLVAERQGVRFVNDSKATNADAAAKALACYDDIHWILGGRAKAGGLDGLEPFMDRIRHAYLIGEASDRFAAWLEGKASYSRCGTLERAVAQAAAAAGPGSCVLLSPACASFDQFANFEARGAAFAAAVEHLAKAGGTP